MLPVPFPFSSLQKHERYLARKVGKPQAVCVGDDTRPAAAGRKPHPVSEFLGFKHVPDLLCGPWFFCQRACLSGGVRFGCKSPKKCSSPREGLIFIVVLVGE